MNSNPQNQITRVLRLPQVVEATGLSKTHIYRLMQRGQFPLPAHLSERVVVWDANGISAWLTHKFIGEGIHHE